MGALGAADARSESTAKPPEPNPPAPELSRAETEHDDDQGGDPFVQPQESRRERARRLQQEAIDASLARERSEWERKLNERDQQWQQRYGDLHGQLQHTRGQLEQFQRQPPGQQQQGPDPDALDSEAKKLLDSGDFAGYERTTRQAEGIRRQRAIEEAVGPLKRQLEERGNQQQLDPLTLSLLGRHHNVAMAGDRGAALVRIKVQEQNFRGVYGPPALAKAFELAEAEFAAGQQQQQQQHQTARFDQSSAAALSGVSGNGRTSGGGGGEERKPLTAYENQVRRAMRGNDGKEMSEEEYRAWRDNPEEAAERIRRKRA